jgi:hypothetical protein
MMALLPLAFTTSALARSASVRIGSTFHVSDERVDPDFGWYLPTAYEESAAFAGDTAEQSISASNRWPATGTHNLFMMGGDSPPGSDEEPASGVGNHYAASGVVTPSESSRAYSFGYTYGYGSQGMGTWRMSLHGFAWADSADQQHGGTSARVVDPGSTVFWSDTEDHTVVMHWYDVGARIQLEETRLSSAEAGFRIESHLDLDNDGSVDQLFWAAEAAWTDGANAASFELGPDVYQGSGPAELATGGYLAGKWKGPGDFCIGCPPPGSPDPGLLSATFCYPVSTGSPGSIAYTVDGYAWARIEPVPEPTTLLFLALAGFLTLRRLRC